MSKKDDRATKASKVPKTVYLSLDVVHRLEKAAETEGMSQSVYIEQMLRARLRKNSLE